MKTIQRYLVALVLAVTVSGVGLLPTFTVPAHALSADTTAAWKQARSAGHLSEGPGGYLQVVTASYQDLADSVNAHRRTLYLKKARELGVPLSEVEKAFGKKLMGRR